MSKKILTQATYDTNNIQSQPDQVKGQAVALKLSFDQTGIDAKSYNNSTLLAEIQSETPNDSGANAIGAEGTFGANNVGDELKAAKIEIDSKADTGNVVTIVDAQTVTGEKTFQNIKVPLLPVDNEDPASKKYVLDTAQAGMPLYNPLEFYQVDATGTTTQGSTLPTDNATNITNTKARIFMLGGM